MTEHSALQVVDLTADNSPRSGATAVSAIAAVTSAAAVTTTASAPTSRSLLEDDDNDAASKCSICVEEVDYRGSALVQCHRCKLRVHVKCYGTSLPTDDSPWVCEACLYFTGADNTNEPATVQRIPPQCVICPITGGALRRTTQSGAWCHVLCVNWIPELSHSLPDTLDTPLDISMLQPNRETLRCIVCGQKGGCIQCISGRCARAFHPICAQRAPSSLIFMGYNNDNQQVYHCKMHLSDIATRKFEMVDTTWKQKPMVKKFLLEHPEAPGKCRVCANKMAGREQKDRHEVQCLLGWVTREEATNRKKLMAKLGIKPVKIEYKAKSGGGDKGATPERSGGKKKRQHAAMKPCRECGELVQESLMLGHLRKRCPQATETKGRAKNPKNPGVMKRRNSGTPSDNQVVDLSQSESNVQSDLSDVLFATWPGQTSGSLMDSTHWWKVVNSNFFSGKNLAKRRMESTCRNACGARLDDIGNFTKKASEQAWTCTDTAIMDRRPEDPNTLSIKSMLHRCDFLMRMSRIRCMEDVQVRPLIDVEHIASSENGSTDPPSAPANATTTSEQNVMSVKVVFQNTENMAMSCKFSMHRPRKDGGSHKRPLGGAVWSQYQQNREVLLAGHIMQDPAYSQRQEELWIALEDCEEVDVSKFEQLPPMNITEPDELTPEINLLMAQLNEQLHTNRYGLRPLCHKLQLTDHAERILRNKASVTEAYYKEFVWWKCLSKCLMVGYKDVTKVVDTDKDATDAPTSDDNDDNENEEPIDDGTCVICFDGQSPESNPIIFCDRCDLAVHQRCYGVVEVPSSDFYCDCCQIEDDGEDPAVSVFCQLCSLRDGAFKKTVDGKWVHVVCALWCPGVWIGNLMSLTEIRLVGGVNKPRFVDNLHEVEARLTDTTPAMSASDATTMTMLHTQAPPLRHGSLCIFCRVACGRTIQCCEGVCGTSFHALCAWFHGLPMTITLTDHGFVYFGGGAGLKFQIHCESHLPERYSVETCRSEGKRRGRFRIDSFFVTQSKRERFSASRVEDPLLGGRIAKALLAELDPTGGQSHFTDREMCSACFEYESPVLDGEEIDVHKFSLRQFLVRCQYCNVYIHPACCSSEMDSPSEIYRSNWICERCTVLNGSSPQPCVICDQSSDYMMPCADADPSGQVAKTAKLLESQGPTNPSNGSSMLLLQNAMASQVPRHLLNQRLQQNNSQEQKLQQTRPVQYNKWVHAFCREWAKMKVARRHGALCAQAPPPPRDIATRCDICSNRSNYLVNCEVCQKRFHPICAARRKYFYTRSTKQDWKFYCFQHPPPLAAFDEKRQAWITDEVYRHLQHLRRELERGRMVVEMIRQRDRERRRFLNTCLKPYFESSIEMITHVMPTEVTKTVYQHLTGEVLEAPTHRLKRKKQSHTPPPSRRQVAKEDVKPEGNGDSDFENSCEASNSQRLGARRRNSGSSVSRSNTEESATTPASLGRRSMRIRSKSEDSDFESPVQLSKRTRSKSEDSEFEMPARKSKRAKLNAEDSPQKSRSTPRRGPKRLTPRQQQARSAGLPMDHFNEEEQDQSAEDIKNNLLAWLGRPPQADFDELVPKEYHQLIDQD